MTEEQKYQRFDDYLDGKMSGDEQRTFESDLASDSRLSAEFERYQAMKLAVVSNDIDLLRQEMSADFAKTGKTKLIRNIALIAVVSILGIAGYFFYTGRNNSDELVENDFPYIDERSSQNEETTIEENSTESVKQPQIQESTNKTEKSVENSKDVSISSTDSSVVVSNETNEMLVVETEKNPVAAEDVKSNVENLDRDVNDEQSDVVKCPGQKLDFTVRIESAHLDANDGSIRVINMKNLGFTEPFEYKLSEDEEFGTKSVFTDLEVGKYSIDMMDSKGCTGYSSKEFEIKMSGCAASVEEIFAPASGMKWRLPIMSSKGAHIELKDRSGRTIFTSEVDGEAEFEWDGTTRDGAISSPGYIWYFVTYTDGEICKGGFNVVD